jgi:hypothetical protein
MKQVAARFVALLGLTGSAFAQTPAGAAHPFVGKTCTARGDSTGVSGVSGAGKYDFQFVQNDRLLLKWTGDSGRIANQDLAFEGMQDKFLVFKTRTGGTVHVDRNANGGTSLFGNVTARFGQMTCR